MRIAAQAWFAAAMAVVALAPALSAAQVRTDASLGRAGQALAGPQFAIPEALGRLRGSNLFHSFSVFNVHTGESATFTTTTRGVGNVITRVSGGDASLINGALRLAPADGAPNFFFINPAGVTFGAGASIDVPGAFHVSTADYLRFGDGTFYADPTSASTLSSAPPEAFGFLGSHRASINVVNGARLSTALLQPFSIVAGDIRVSGAQATSRGGDIRIVAVGAPASEVRFSGALPTAHGSLQIVSGALIFSPESSDNDSGSIAMSAGHVALLAGGLAASVTSGSGHAGSITVEAGNIFINAFGGGLTGIVSQANGNSTGNAGAIDVRARANLEIVNGGVISSSTFGHGRAGSVKAVADTIYIDAEGNRSANTWIASRAAAGTGDAGSVEILARSLTLLQGGQINSSSVAAGNAGSVTISTGDFTIEGKGNGFTGVFSEAAYDTPGNAGNVNVAASGDLLIKGGGRISTTTQSEGNGGAIRVSAHNITIDGDRSFTDTGISSRADFGGGSAGSVDVTAADSLLIKTGGLISSDSYAFGDAGSVRVSAPNITIIGGDTVMTGIASRALLSRGDAGTVDVIAPVSLRILNGARITSATQSFFGRAGSVNVTAGSLVVDGSLDRVGNSSITAEAFPFSSGQTGNVTVRANDITLSNGGELSITNRADTFLNDVVPRPTLIFVSAPTITLRDGGAITAAASFDYAASNIHVDVGSRLMLIDSAITTSAFDGNGGFIRITGDGALVLRNSQITTSVEGFFGNGGDISIGTRALVMDSGFIRANTAADEASGGNVSIGVRTLIPSGNSLFVGGEDPVDFRPGVFGLNVIQAAAPTGLSGEVSISTPVLDISAGLVGLSARVLDSGGLGRSLCEMTGGSSLAQAGRGAMPPSARDFARAEEAGSTPRLAMAALTHQRMPALNCSK